MQQVLSFYSTTTTTTTLPHPGHLTCISRRLMKPLFSTSHIWKNSWVFSRIVFCPRSPLSDLAGCSLPSCLGRPARAATVVLVEAQGAAKAAMVSIFFPCCYECFWRPSHVAGSGGDEEGRDPGARRCSTSEALTNVTDCHLLATGSLISQWNLGERGRSTVFSEISAAP